MGEIYVVDHSRQGNTVFVKFSDGHELQVVAVSIYHQPMLDIEQVWVLDKGQTLFELEFRSPQYTEGTIHTRTDQMTPQKVAEYFRIAQDHVQSNYLASIKPGKPRNEQSPFYSSWRILCVFAIRCLEWLEFNE